MEGLEFKCFAPHMLSVCLLASMPSAYAAEQPEPVVMIHDYQLPQFVSDIYFEQKENTAKSIALYHQLRKGFNLSHTQLASFLGLKRRSLYNWLDEPSSSRKNKIVELRLSNLSALHNEMDVEHKALLSKIAFSPIDGEPKFGEALIKGASTDELISWYDELYEKFDVLV